MTMHHFTIIVPTRERSDTLLHTLRTCVEQDYDNLTILVSDNDSGDATRDVVASFRDGRIQYVNTGRRLAMSQNWEFALSHVHDGYVTYLGDDDGLLLNSLHDINGILDAHPAPALSWKKIEYGWPDHIDELQRNFLQVSMSSRGERWQGLKMLEKLRSFTIGYNDLPCVYNSFVDVQLITRIREAGQGVFFQCMNPDIYSGIALSCFVGEYLYSHRPFSLNGASRHSTGTSSMLPHRDQAATQKFQKEVGPNEFDPSLTACSSILVHIADALLKAQRAYPDQKLHLTFDLRDLMRKMLQHAVGGPYEQFESVRQAVSDMGLKNGLRSYTDGLVERFTNHPVPPQVHFGWNTSLPSLTIDASICGVRTIYDASRFCSHILQKSTVSFDESWRTALERNVWRILRRRR